MGIRLCELIDAILLSNRYVDEFAELVRNQAVPAMIFYYFGELALLTYSKHRLEESANAMRCAVITRGIVSKMVNGLVPDPSQVSELTSGHAFFRVPPPRDFSLENS